MVSRAAAHRRGARRSIRVIAIYVIDGNPASMAVQRERSEKWNR